MYKFISLTFLFFCLLLSLLSSSHLFAQDIVWSDDFENQAKNILPDNWERVVDKRFSTYGRFDYPVSESQESPSPNSPIPREGQPRGIVPAPNPPAIRGNTFLQFRTEGKSMALTSMDEFTLSPLYFYQLHASLKTATLKEDQASVALYFYDKHHQFLYSVQTDPVRGSTHEQWTKVFSPLFHPTGAASYAILYLQLLGSDIHGTAAFDNLSLTRYPYLSLHWKGEINGIVSAETPPALTLSLSGLSYPARVSLHLETPEHQSMAHRNLFFPAPSPEQKPARLEEKKLVFAQAFSPGLYLLHLDVQEEQKSPFSWETSFFVLSHPDLPSQSAENSGSSTFQKLAASLFSKFIPTLPLDEDTSLSWITLTHPPSLNSSPDGDGFSTFLQDVPFVRLSFYPSSDLSTAPPPTSKKVPDSSIPQTGSLSPAREGASATRAGVRKSSSPSSPLPDSPTSGLLSFPTSRPLTPSTPQPSTPPLLSRLDKVAEELHSVSQTPILYQLLPWRERITYLFPIPTPLGDFFKRKSFWEEKLPPLLKKISPLSYFQLGEDSDESLFSTPGLLDFSTSQLPDSSTSRLPEALTALKAMVPNATLLLPADSESDVALFQSLSIVPLLPLSKCSSSYAPPLFTSLSLSPGLLDFSTSGLPDSSTSVWDAPDQWLKTLFRQPLSIDYFLLERPSLPSLLDPFSHLPAPLLPYLYGLSLLKDTIWEDHVEWTDHSATADVPLSFSLYRKSLPSGEKSYLAVFWSETHSNISFTMPVGKILQTSNFFGEPLTFRLLDSQTSGLLNFSTSRLPNSSPSPRQIKNGFVSLTATAHPAYIEFTGPSPIRFQKTVQSFSLTPLRIQSSRGKQTLTLTLTNFFDAPIQLHNLIIETPSGWTLNFSHASHSLPPHQLFSLPILLSLPSTETLGEKTMHLSYQLAVGGIDFPLVRTLVLNIVSPLSIHYQTGFLKENGLFMISITFKNTLATPFTFRVTAATPQKILPVDFVINAIQPGETKDFSIVLNRDQIQKVKKVLVFATEVEGANFFNVPISVPESPP